MGLKLVSTQDEIPAMAPRPPDAKIVALITALQCLYVLDFMLVLPLGPDLASALHMPASQVAWLTAAYTLASMVAGLTAVPHLDRFDRRRVLLCCLAGQVLALSWCASATDGIALLVGRAAAGFFGAPSLATGMAILIDQTHPAQRGAAVGKVMSGFAIASVLGVPLMLELSARWGWFVPFMLVAVLLVVLMVAVFYGLPPLPVHSSAPVPHAKALSVRQLIAQPRVRLACWLQMINQFAAFLIIPNFAAFYLLNLQFPRQELGVLYGVGGLCAFFGMRWAGRMQDRYGFGWPMGLANVSFIVGLLPFFEWSLLPISLCFIAFMVGNGARTVCLSSILSHIPSPAERAGFMALLKIMQDLGVTLAAGVAVLILDHTQGALHHTAILAGLAVLGGLSVLICLRRLSHMA